mgnify:CR=1 FL=1
MPFSLAGLLRLARFCVLHHNSVLIGLPCSVNVQSLSLVRCDLFNSMRWEMFVDVVDTIVNIYTLFNGSKR